MYTHDAFPFEWAQTQNNLGLAYVHRIRGEWAENLERAIECFNYALTVLTAEAFPHDHEIVARNLKQALSPQRSFHQRLRSMLRRLSPSLHRF